MRSILVLILLSIAAVPLKAADEAAQPPTDQTKRGQQLFLNSPKGTACGTCHALAGQGTAVGPDLKNIAAFAMPRGIVTAIRMSTTETVQAVAVSGNTPFPARVVEKQGGVYKLWNLSNIPPVLQTVPDKDVTSIARDTSWKHPPASAGYTTKELADIVGYLRWAASGNTKTVTEEEVGSSQ